MSLLRNPSKKRMADVVKHKYGAWGNDLYERALNGPQARLRDLCRSNLKFLCKEMLGMSKWDDSLHDDLAAYLEASGPNKLILIPRGHLKSSIVTVGWSIQQILRNPNTRILIRNAVWDKARMMMGSIQSYLEDGPLPLIFGDFRTNKTYWTKDGLTIHQRKDKVKKEPTLMSAGLETSLTGYHYDIVVDDDLVDLDNSVTKEQIQKVIRVYNDSFNLLDRGGTHVLVGTRWNLRDLYGHVLNTDLATVNGVKVDLDEGNEAWRKAYREWVQKRG